MKFSIPAIVLSLTLVICLPAICVAEDEAPSPPLLSMTFEVTGIVTGIEPSFGVIAIDGREYRMAEGIKVQSLVSDNPGESLKVGAEVGYVAYENESNGSSVSEIWVLSAPVAQPDGASVR